MDITFSNISLLIAAFVSAVSICMLVIMPLKLKKRFGDSLTAFSTAVEARCAGRLDRTEEVFALARKVAAALRLTRSERENLLNAIRIRDVGLCATAYKELRSNNHFINKPSERLQSDEHPKVGARMITDIPSFAHLVDIVLHHHSPFSSSGDSSELSGADIPIEARIICAVDAFISIRRNVGDHEASSTLIQGRGTVFCPSVVDALLAVISFERVCSRREFVETA